MPFVDRIIQFLLAQQGERIVLENDQACVLCRADGTASPTSDRLSLHQLTNMVSEILPDEHRTAFASGDALQFCYDSGRGLMELQVTQDNGTIRIYMGFPGSLTKLVPVIEAAPPEAPEEEERPNPVNAEQTPLLPATVQGGRRIQHIDALFRYLKENEASDLHLSSNEKPYVRIHGSMRKLDEYEINHPEHLKKILWDITPQRNQEEWEARHDTDFAYELSGVARFRCNLFSDRHGPGGVFRLIPSKIATVKDLGLAQAMVDLCFLSKGLVVVTGPTGSGKSTTLAALVDHVNKHRTDHIVTIEDPVEFVHENLNCLLTQREVHVHTTSFSRALRAALREDPDIVLVGEMRDLETIAIAIETAETGHLVFGTLHTSTASSTIDRIIDQFPADQQEQIRVMLSESLKGVIAQTLCRTTEGRRVAAFEILIVDPACANLIREGKTYQLPSMMQIGKDRGCITMNESLMVHVRSGRVDPREAYIKAMDKAGLLMSYNRESIKLDLSRAE